MNKIKAVVIDDEFFNRGLITMLIDKLNTNFVVSGEAENLSDGFKLINTVNPDIVFLDIKMPDGSGFDLLKKFDVIDFEVVFITGFDKYALQAFEHNALDYVLKPIDLDKFKITLDRVQQRIEKQGRNHKMLKQVVNSLDYKEGLTAKIQIDSGDRVELINLNNVMYIQNGEGATTFTKYPLEKSTSVKPLSDFEFIIKNFSNFIKIDADTFINLNYISSFSKDGKDQIKMQDGAVLEITPEKRVEIVDIFNQWNNTGLSKTN